MNNNELGHKLTQIYQQLKPTIPTCNRETYNVVFSDYRHRILAEPERYDEFAAELWERIQALRNPEAVIVPPGLYREPGEPARDYLDRCYAIHIPEHAPISKHQKFNRGTRHYA